MSVSRTASGVHGFFGRDPGVVARASLDPRLMSVSPPGFAAMHESVRLTGSRSCGSMHGMSITIELPPDVEKRLAGLPDLGQRVADFLRGQAEQLAAGTVADSPRLRALDALQARLALDAGKADEWTAAVRDARR